MSKKLDAEDATEELSSYLNAYLRALPAWANAQRAAGYSGDSDTGMAAADLRESLGCLLRTEYPGIVLEVDAEALRAARASLQRLASS